MPLRIRMYTILVEIQGAEAAAHQTQDIIHPAAQVSLEADSRVNGNSLTVIAC